MTVYEYTLTCNIATDTGVNFGGGQNNQVVANEDVDVTYTVYQSPDESTEEDLSSYTSFEWILIDPSDGSTVTTYTKSGGGIAFATDGTDGKVTVSIAATDTSGLDASLYPYQLKAVDGSSNDIVLAQGEVNVEDNLS